MLKGLSVYFEVSVVICLLVAVFGALAASVDFVVAGLIGAHVDLLAAVWLISVHAKLDRLASIDHKLSLALGALRVADES